MSYNYTAAMTLYINDLPDIINMYGENPIFLSIFNKIDKNYIYDDHIAIFKNYIYHDYIAIFKWQYLNNFISTPEYKMLKEIAGKFNADLIIINDNDEIIDEEYKIGILYCQSPTPLAPDDIWLEQSWRVIENLKTYIKEKYGDTDENIQNIINNS